MISATGGVAVGKAGVGGWNSSVGVWEGTSVGGTVVSVGLGVIVAIGAAAKGAFSIVVSNSAVAGWLEPVSRYAVSGALGGSQKVASAPYAPPVAQDTEVLARNITRMVIVRDLCIGMVSTLQEVFRRVACVGFHLLITQLEIAVIFAASADGYPAVQLEGEALVGWNPLTIILAG